MIYSSSRDPSQGTFQTPRILKLVLATVGAVLVVALVSGFVWWPKSPTHLVNANPEVKSQWLRHWEAGEVVVLIRHTERCDRSTNPCLGPADGITRVGSDAAAGIGQGLVRLGMTQADVLSSPLTRAVQTAHYMLGKDAQTQEWLVSCGSTLSNDVVAHKRTRHNLVLVTHSGCISDFEAQTGFKHAQTSEYGSSLFVTIGADGQLQVLGIVNATDWGSVLDKKH